MEVFRLSQTKPGGGRPCKAPEPHGLDRAVIYSHGSSSSESTAEKTMLSELGPIDSIRYRLLKKREGKGKIFAEPSMQQGFRSNGVSLEAVSGDISELESDIKNIRPGVVVMSALDFKLNKDRLASLKSRYGFKLVVENHRDIKGMIESMPGGLLFSDSPAAMMSEESRRSVRMDSIIDAVFDPDGLSYVEEFGKAYRSIRNKASNESLASQLEGLFPGADAHSLEKAVTSLDTGFQDLRKTTDRTYSGIVMDFDIDGKRVYCKASDNKIMLAKEAQYHEDAWSIALMRPITPKLVGLIDAGDFAALMTYGTENREIVYEADVALYLAKRNKIITDFAKRMGCDPVVIHYDPHAIDAFNRAVAHTFMRQYACREIYSENQRELIIPFDRIIERAGTSVDSRLFSFLCEQSGRYHKAVSDYQEVVDNAPLSLIYYDARPENIFPEAGGARLRPVGDFGFARPGPVEFDLSRMESRRDPAYVPLYAFARNRLEQEGGNDFELSGDDVRTMQEKVLPLSFINMVRTMSFKMSRNCNQEAGRYQALISQMS